MDPLLLLVGSCLLSLWATYRVKTTYYRYSRIEASSGTTGCEVAAAILDRAGIHDVCIVEGDSLLGDHYDPAQKQLVLRRETFHGRSLADLGIAAHECGHAIQDKTAYPPLQWRMAAVGITSIAHQMLWIPLLAIVSGVIQPYTATWIMALAWGIIMLFNLVTLPVEFDASKRAKQLLVGMGFIGSTEEMEGVRETLDAAAWTYVAAFVISLGHFVSYLAPLLLGNSRRGEE